MSKPRLYVYEVTSCDKCPACKERRGGIFDDFYCLCKMMDRRVTKAAKTGTIDPRCPLEEVKK